MLRSPYIPDFGLLPDLFRQRHNARIQAKEEHGFTRQWFLLAGRAEKAGLLNPQPASLHKLLPPNDRMWADPFLWRRGESFAVFCEEWVIGEPHGHISVMQLAEDGSAVSSPTRVISESYHLSYPFLFEYEGELYMMPESGAGRSLDVYRCEEFPHRWTKHKTLMKDIRFADATLQQHGGRWWLFITIRRGFSALSRDLFIFSADNPLSERWTPHPRNPVVRGYQGARPAGALFELDGRLYRPSQDCLLRYGHGLRINEVTQFDSRYYRERLVTEVHDWEVGIRATHHIGWMDGTMVMDTQRLLRNSEITP